MRYDDKGAALPTDLFEAALLGFTVTVLCCRCDRVATFDAHALWSLFHRKHWPDGYNDIGKRLACQGERCAARERRAGTNVVSFGRNAVSVALPMPDEREWRREVARRR